MRIALLGDVHGDLDRLEHCIQAAATAGMAAVIQLGDLGFSEQHWGPGRPWPRWPIPVLAIDGNHEDHGFLAQAHASGLATAWAGQGLAHQPRGSSLRLGGRQALFLGGALHANCRQAEEGGNLISAEDLSQALAEARAHPPEVVFSHSCPANIGIGMHGNPALAESVHRHILVAGHECGPPDDCGEPLLSELWQALPRRPALWCFGHFHRAHQRQLSGTRFIAVAAAAVAEMLVWDTRTMAVTGWA